MMDIGSIEKGKVKIKILSTNSTSITLRTDQKFKNKVIQPEKTGNRLIAEHGLAMSIFVSDGEASQLFLIDTGGLNQSIFHNLEQFKLDLKDIDKIILTHGHFDHFGGLAAFIPKLKQGSEIILNPICFEQNHFIFTASGEEIPAEELGISLRQLKKDGVITQHEKIPSLNKKMIYDLASKYEIKIIETSAPIKLCEGIVTSGEIELFDKKEATQGVYLELKKKEFIKHTFRDEITLYINIKDAGLAVITGCGHAGLANTIRHGQKLTGVEKINSIIGGFHKEYETLENIESTVKFIENVNPEITCGMHCTGFNFQKIMSRHPSHVLGITGTTFHL